MFFAFKDNPNPLAAFPNLAITHSRCYDNLNEGLDE